MKLKTKVFVSALFLTSLSTLAQTKLVITGTNGKETNVEIQKISEITFSEAGMTIVATDGTQTVPIADIVELTFNAKQSGTTNTVAELGDLKVSLADGILTATAPEPLKLTVYNLQGQPVASVSGENEVSLDFQPMSKGVYIVRINNKTIKVNR